MRKQEGIRHGHRLGQFMSWVGLGWVVFNHFSANRCVGLQLSPTMVGLGWVRKFKRFVGLHYFDVIILL